jgi:hypothetical protein
MLAHSQRLAQRGQQTSARFTRWRLAIFIAGLLCSVIPYKLGWFAIGNAALALFVLIFLVVAWYHNRLEDRLHRLRLWQEIKRRHVARVTLDWASLPPPRITAPEKHPYAADLDLTGTHGFLTLIDTTVSSTGRERLASWLLSQPPDSNRWRTRQALIKELASLARFRDRLVLEAALISEPDINGERLRVALAAPVDSPNLIPLLFVETGLAIVTISLAVTALLGWVPSYWMLSFAAYALIYLMVGGRSEEIFEQAVLVHMELEKLGAVYACIERRSFRATPKLDALCRTLREGPMKPSQAIRQAARLMHRLSIRVHPLVHLGVNALGPWDLYYTLRLQQLKDRILAHLPLWLDTLAELDAAAALANVAYLHPTYTWPSLFSDAVVATSNGQLASLIASHLGHPLIPAPQRVANDLTVKGTGHILLVTGSNMSGKSTFLRSVGINVCLAQAGAPVCAGQFEWSWTKLMCCIRVEDSITSGLSFFYAEVKRLKVMLDAMQDHTTPPVLFLIDEIFKGTNNRERLIGSRAYISALSTGNGYGLITTHDLELTELERTLPTLTNAHFQETVQAGSLAFDFILRPGPCPTTNALRIMELEGLPVQESPHR